MLLPSIKMMMPVPLAPSLLSFLFLQNKKQNFQAIHDVVGHRNALKSMLKIEGKTEVTKYNTFSYFQTLISKRLSFLVFLHFSFTLNCFCQEAHKRNE